MVGSWEVVIATLHTDLVHNLLVPLMSYVSIKPSSLPPATAETRIPAFLSLPAVCTFGLSQHYDSFGTYLLHTHGRAICHCTTAPFHHSILFQSLSISTIMYIRVIRLPLSSGFPVHQSSSICPSISACARLGNLGGVSRVAVMLPPRSPHMAWTSAPPEPAAPQSEAASFGTPFTG